MGEIFRLQLHLVMGGRKKWLVLLFLGLPLLLTGLTAHVGGLRDVKEEIRRWERDHDAEGRRRPPGPGTGATLIEPGDEPVRLLGGRLVVTREGVFFRKKKIGPHSTLDARCPQGRYQVRRQQVWFTDEPSQGTHISYSRHGGFRAGRFKPPPWELVCAVYLFAVYPLAVSLLLALLYGPSLLGSELDNKTLTYLFTRPVARWRVITGKYLAVVFALLPPAGVSLLLSWLLLAGAGGGGLLAAMLAATVGAILTYTALFTLAGLVIPRRAMVAALIYAVVFELVLTFVPALVRKLTISYYLRSLALEIDPPELELAELPREVADLLSWEPLGSSLGVLGAVVVVSLVASSVLAARREYVITDQV